MAYIMRNMTVEDMQNLQTKTVIIPIGVVEQHGYHLPLSVDICNVEKPLEIAADRLNALIAPTVNYCFSGGELRGTVNVSPNVFGLYVTDICKEFVRMGFLNLILFLGHGGTENEAALRDSLQMFLRSSAAAKDITVSLVPVWDLCPGWKYAEGDQNDFHAGRTETSLMMYWASDLVRKKIVTDEPEFLRMMRTDQDYYAKSEKLIDHPCVMPRVGQKDELKIGVMGFPELATKEIGEELANQIVENLIKYVDMVNEKNGGK